MIGKVGQGQRVEFERICMKYPCTSRDDGSTSEYTLHNLPTSTGDSADRVGEWIYCRCADPRHKAMQILLITKR
jgi:hypothetical protein